MTSEGKPKTEKWISDRKALYPYGYDDKGKLTSYFGIRGIPHAVLLDPNGTIVWRGHPGTLKEEQIEAALDGALTYPVYQWPDAAAPVREHLSGRRFAAALAAAEKLEPESATRISEALRVMVRGRVTAVRRSLDSGDYLAAFQLGKQAQAGLEGLEQGQEIGEMLSRIESDEQAMAVLKAQEQLSELLAEQNGVKNRRAAQDLITRLQKLKSAYPDTIVARNSEAAIARLQRNMRRLK